MFINLDKKQILNLEQAFQADFVALWDTMENASSFYMNVEGIFTAYTEINKNIEFSFSTPIKVYKIYSKAFDIL
ncbi:MAG: hypothetical protein K0R71_1799 [Bacillales bacterium]|jgi:hypothetical protein|nr:hypothetical protein [Bacillales bacterium]